jgi:hypothetical protein
MELSRISSAPYRARVRRVSKSRLSSVHRANSVRFRSIRVVNGHHISSASQQLSKKDSQSAHHATTIRSEPASDIKLSRISSTPSRPLIKRIDRSNIQSIHDNKSLKLHTEVLNKISRIRSTDYRHRGVMTPGQRGLLSANDTWNTNSRITQVSLFTDMKSA